jgi:predicted nucleotidyltransferase component of viral defense system
MNAGAMSFKAQIRNLAKKKNIKAQVLLQNYMFERFLERLSLSEYNEQFILKGGMLVAAIVGMETRSTMDLDTTIRGLPLTEENIRHAVTAICAFPIQDNVNLTVGTIAPIRADDIYGGYRVKITALYDTIEVPISIDISTGDVITPHPIKHTFSGIFDEEKQIEIWAYNIETVMAEKVETILRRNIFNTRPRDFYDIFILSTTQSYNRLLLKEAVSATALHRGTTEQIADVSALLQIITDSADLRQMWKKYCREFDYAKDITYEQVIKTLCDICIVLM